MNKRFIHLALLLVASAATAAHADGTVEDYDHSDTAIARTLSPDEYLVNADGAQEDASHRMSDTARAYRNGLIAGRKEAEAKQQAAQLPPLPAGTTLNDAQRDDTPPPVAAPRYRQVARPAAPAPQYADDVTPQTVRQPYVRYVTAEQPQRPAQYVAQQNVYASAPVYAQQEDDAEEGYAPPPPPIYAPPAPRYVYVQPPPRMVMPPPVMMERTPPIAYWSRGYVPAAPVASPYAYQSY